MVRAAEPSISQFLLLKIGLLRYRLLLKVGWAPAMSCVLRERQSSRTFHTLPRGTSLGPIVSRDLFCYTKDIKNWVIALSKRKTLLNEMMQNCVHKVIACGKAGGQDFRVLQDN